MRTLDRYRRDDKFKEIVNATAKSEGATVDDVLLRIHEMEYGLKKLMESSDNRDIYLKYIGSFSMTHRGMSRKLKYFIRLCRKGFLDNKEVIRKTFYDLKKKNLERIEKKRKRLKRLQNNK